MSAPGPNPDPIMSEFEDDPDMQELVELFRADLPERIRELETSSSTGDIDSLAVLAHQMKGASGGYGYPSISVAAGSVERIAKSDDLNTDELIRATEDLIDLCRRAAWAG